MLKLEELTLQPEKPELVVSEANDTHGLDLLGLRAPAESVANRLINGVTTVTPTIRYFSFRSWVILRYLKLGGLKSWDAFSRFASKAEATIAYASNLVGDPTAGVVGRNVAAGIVTKTNGTITLRRLTKILAAELYAGPSEGLGLGESNGEVPTLTPERGLPLAESFDAVVGTDDILSEISLEHDEQIVDRARLTQFGHSFTMARPSLRERELLVAALIPKEPRRSELPRIASYCLLLHLSRALGRTIGESDVYRAVSQHSLAEIPEELHVICDAWVQFVVRDLLVLVHEAAVSNVLQQLSLVPRKEKRQPFRDVIAALASRDIDSGFLGLGLKISAAQPIRDLCASVTDSCGPTEELRGLRRWSGTLSETLLFEKKAWLQSAEGFGLLPVAWIIGAHRLELGLNSKTVGSELDDIAGAYRIGVGAVVLPEVKKWRTSSMSVRDVIAWLIHRSVDQHLRIAWSRLAREPYKDVGLIRSDGDDWVYQKDFNPGRATSRIYQALSWLSQLGLLVDSGLTDEGSDLLDAGLATLRRAATN
ncbi:MAG: hypothetical protein U0Q18_16890 [Bryobacteraceae bacterium]